MASYQHSPSQQDIYQTGENSQKKTNRNHDLTVCIWKNP